MPQAPFKRSATTGSVGTSDAMISGDEGTDYDSEGGSVADLKRRRKTAARRKSRAARLSRYSATTESPGDAVTMEEPVHGNLPVGATWKEIVTGVLLVAAFGSCLSVFIMLGRRKEAALEADQACDARTLLQLKLASYIHQGGNLSKATEGLGSSAVLETNCACPTAQQMEELETILYVLLVGALLTVSGVVVLVIDDEDSDGNVFSKAKRMPRRFLTMSREKLGEMPGRRSVKKPIADLFPDTSVLFADIIGFEAWSSQREPTQCLTLLETVYDAFDQQARAQGIFKVEAVADCYTAAAGLPEQRKDHAEAMAFFATTCLKLFNETTKSLEASLGPDTSDLSLRVGVHSGPVTAIRGGSSRFQLFGDTVTTAASILNSSQAGKIQLSRETVQLLPQDMQSEWVKPRKGDNSKLYWLVMPGLEEEDDVVQVDDRIPRLVDWNVELLKPVLLEIVAKRHAANKSSSDNDDATVTSTIKLINEQAVDQKLRQGKLVIDEVEEVIKLPKYNAALAKAQEEQDETVELSDQVVDQLREYIMTIAHSYKNNPFHNFAHASHVTMSVQKLLSRILAPKLETKTTFDVDDSDESLGGNNDEGSNGDESDDDDDSDYSSIDEDLKQRIHDHTYGITSDALTQFACMFSALIHDAEHEGVPNAQLVKEETELAARYRNQSVAEQNSVDVGWNLLMEERFQALRNAIYSNEAEMVHFRKLVVTCVMATDICDKQLKDQRNNRWERAFAPKTAEEQKHPDPALLEMDVHRKATIVIEHLLQASDVAHTMQHFHVFRKWNERLFLEMYLAFKKGRSTSDPSKFWYKGEIGFFDFYVIPLAKKLKECGVFGVSSDEYLNYATKNRQEWESRGTKIVEGLIAKAELTYARLQRHGSMDLKNSNHRIMHRTASMNSSMLQNAMRRASMGNSSSRRGSIGNSASMSNVKAMRKASMSSATSSMGASNNDSLTTKFVGMRKGSIGMSGNTA